MTFPRCSYRTSVRHLFRAAASARPNRLRPIAIVTDGMWRKSLSAIRSLGKGGFSVHVLGDSWLTVGFWSRFTVRRVLVKDAKDGSSEFGSALTRYLERLYCDSAGRIRPVLLPMEDESLRYVIENRAQLSRCAEFLVPGRTAFATCTDKAA